MKRLLAIFLLLSLIAPLGGAYLGFRFEKTRIKKAVKRQIIAGISKEELVEFKFLKSDTSIKLNWEHNREFEFKDKMYDIVNRYSNNDSVIYWCWCDNAENLLSKQFNELVAKALGSDPLKSESKKQLIDYLKTLYYPSNLAYQNQIYFLVTATLIAESELYQNSCIISPVGPPPKIQFASV